MSSQPRIHCPLCILRPWREADRADLLGVANNAAIARQLRDLFPHPYAEADADRWIAWATRPRPTDARLWDWELAIEVEGRAAGGIAVGRQQDVERHAVEIGYWLGEPHWNRGIATEAVRALTRAALAEPEIYRVFAAVFATNPASMRVLEK